MQPWRAAMTASPVLSQTARNIPVKASPAPVVSTASTGRAGTATGPERSGGSTSAPFSPNVSTTGPARRCEKIAAKRSHRIASLPRQPVAVRTASRLTITTSKESARPASPASVRREAGNPVAWMLAVHPAARSLATVTAGVDLIALDMDAAAAIRRIVETIERVKVALVELERFVDDGAPAARLDDDQTAAEAPVGSSPNEGGPYPALNDLRHRPVAFRIEANHRDQVGLHREGAPRPAASAATLAAGPPSDLSMVRAVARSSRCGKAFTLAV